MNAAVKLGAARIALTIKWLGTLTVRYGLIWKTPPTDPSKQEALGSTRSRGFFRSPVNEGSVSPAGCRGRRDVSGVIKMGMKKPPNPEGLEGFSQTSSVTVI